MIETYFNGRLQYDNVKRKCVYYQDVDKKWRFYTNSTGFKLLYKCFRRIEKIHKLYKKKYNIDVNYGKEIYVNKKKYITWTKEDYENESFRYVYIYLKAFQRFTEIWSLMERFSSLIQIHNKRLKILSLGCGPGFECFAIEKFYNNKIIDFYGLDNTEEWGVDFKAHGDNYHFYSKDVHGNDFDKNIDIVIMSNIFANHMINESGLNTIIYLFNKLKTKYVFINDRSKQLNEPIEFLKKYNIKTLYLINKNDHRQICLHKNRYSYIKKKNELTFPNVPYL